MKKYLILILLLVSSCRWFTGATLPPFAMLGVPEPQGTPIFKHGFENGCSTIIHDRGNELFRQRYSYKFDTSLIDNPEYILGFSRGWTNCFNHIVGGRQTLGGSADTYLYNSLWGGGGVAGGGTAFGMGKGDINSTGLQDGKNVWGNPFGFSGGGIDEMWGVFEKGNKGGSNTILGGHPLWGTPQTDQIFGQ